MDVILFRAGRRIVAPIDGRCHGSAVAIGSTDLTLENAGYVVATLRTGSYHGLTAETAEDVIIDAVMMGGDTDTIGAVAGAVARVRVGERALLERGCPRSPKRTSPAGLPWTWSNSSIARSPLVAHLEDLKYAETGRRGTTRPKRSRTLHGPLHRPGSPPRLLKTTQ